MNHEEITQEIERTKLMLAEHRKYLKKLEVKVAKFGLHTPPYLEVDIDTTKEKIELCVRRLDLMVEGNNALVDLDDNTEHLKSEIEGYANTIIHFGDTGDHAEDAKIIQELGIEIAELIVTIDRINKEYNEATKQYSDML